MESSASGYIGEEDGRRQKFSARAGEPAEIARTIDDLEAVYDEMGQRLITVDEFLEDEELTKKLIAHGGNLTHDADAAASLLQEAIERALPTLLEEPRPLGKTFNLLKKTMTHANIDNLRKKKRARGHGDYGDGLISVNPDGSVSPLDPVDDRQHLPSGMSAPEARAIRREIFRKVQDAVWRLPKPQQDVVIFALGLHRDYPGEFLSQSEISELIGVPIDLVHSRRRYGFRTLRGLLEEDWEDWKEF